MKYTYDVSVSPVLPTFQEHEKSIDFYKIKILTTEGKQDEN